MTLPPELKHDIEKYVAGVKGRKGESRLTGKSGDTSLEIAKAAVQILTRVIESIDANIQTMLHRVKEACKLMKAAYPYGPLIANVARRVLYIIREEYQITMREAANRTADAEGDDAKDSEVANNSFDKEGAARVYNPALDSQLTALQSMEQADSGKQLNFSDLKNNIMEHLENNFIDDFDEAQRRIQRQSPEHIAEGEVIMTYGSSQTVEKFLLYAARKRKFQLIICEAAPDCNGHELAAKMQEQNIDTTLIPDTLAHAYMSRASKVVLGTYLVVANGGLVAPAGTHGVAVAAQMHRVPVLVLTAMIKLTPVYPSTTDLCEFGRLRNPGEVMPLSAVLGAAGQNGDAANWLHVVNSSVDYVPPELIALFVTNDESANKDESGRAYAPCYIYRLLHQLYNPEDYSL